MTIRKILTMLIAATCLCGCMTAQDKMKATGEDVTITPEVGKFNAISVSSAFELNYTAGASTSVTVTAPSSISQYVKVETSGGKLNCYYSAPQYKSTEWNDRKVVVNVTAPAVNDFQASGAASIDIKSPISAKRLSFGSSGASRISMGNATSSKCDIDLSGASNITIGNIIATELEIELSGASEAKISGKADNVEIELSGASNCDIKALNISGGKIKTSGASNVKANSSARNCKVSTSGASEVNY